jgi:translation initiation factor IF-3
MNNYQNRNFVRKKKEAEHRINKLINQWGKVNEVRLVGDNVEPGIYPLEEALNMAAEQGVDLVEINPNVVPPICKIIEYQKLLYQLKQKRKEQEKKNRQNEVEVKEIRFGPNTEDHDFAFKKKHAEEFLKNGDKVNAIVFFKGREILFQEKGQALLYKLADELSEIATPETLPKLEGKRLYMMLKPKKK